MKLFISFLLLASVVFEAPAAPGPGPRRARVRAGQAWRGFSGPPYLAHVPRRPGQHVLDSLARVASRQHRLHSLTSTGVR